MLLVTHGGAGIWGEFTRHSALNGTDAAVISHQVNHINSVVIEGDNKDDFVISHDTCTGSTVGANKSCVIDIFFAPAVNERRKATLIIMDNAVDSPQKITLTANGINSINVPPRQE